jgi:hypothetical protein
MNAPKRAGQSARVTPGERNNAPLSSSPAIQQLISESRTFGAEFANALPAYQRVLEVTQREFAAMPEVKSLLEKLKNNGIRPERILKHTIAFVRLEEAPWRSNLQENKVRLRSLAKRLQKVADEVEAIYSSDTSRPELWAMKLGVLTEIAPLFAFKKTVEGMRQAAADLNNKALGFGRVRYAIGPAVRRQPLVSLLRHAYRAIRTNWNDEHKDTRRKSRQQFRRDCLQPLAELLNAVCEKRGVEKTPTCESLEKIFVRYVLPEL